MLSRGRVLKAADASEAKTLIRGQATRAERRGRVMDQRSYEARLEAERIVSEATARARAIVEHADQAAAELRRTIHAEARARATAELAARTLALAEREARLDEQGLERSLKLAALLAERLLGQALLLEPALLLSLARQALAEARGAERIDLLAHPDDARLLEQRFAELGVSADAVVVRADDTRARGNLRLETELGALDAELGPQLERLLTPLREALQRGL
jgi:flagellar biosynthesis/type III secretory pathway protein FliH